MFKQLTYIQNDYDEILEKQTCSTRKRREEEDEEEKILLYGFVRPERGEMKGMNMKGRRWFCWVLFDQNEERGRG